MDLQWLDLPFTVLTLLLATRLAYDYYGVVAAAFAGGFSLQIFLFYCFVRWYRHAIGARAGADGGDDQPPHLPSSSARQEDGTPPVLTPLVETVGGEPASLANRCFPLVFMVLVPLVIVFFERSQADVVAYVLCLANIIVMVVWLSPDSGSTVSAAKSFLRLSDDEDEGSGCSGSGGAVDKCCVCLGGLLEEQALRALPRCGHRFHDKCIVKWLKAHLTCPVCRATAVPPPPPNGDGEPLDDDISPV
ncbi:E3 ubiquitin-protein ligase Os06g0535400-like [Phragmites australis]|uniref:E3 ubiquitin-protein ligase Os06g0535400-like n=1 Tax=Phragmites australis TaxID=29695 RepID=UPI002D77AD7F|nr:E3 ubiquitin-protein ligase Os06g0535400-like [Phragmites australis]